jgi:DMSO reductase family type II enzyme heme b subunit
VPPATRASFPVSHSLAGRNQTVGGCSAAPRSLGGSSRAAFARLPASLAPAPIRAMVVGVGSALVLAAVAQPVFAQGDANAGKAVYELRCAGCHGVKGDGKGPAAEVLLPRPRDFTSGIYKIRTTENKTPADRDLFRIITEGMPGTSMPGWGVLPERDRWNLVAYIKTFAGDKLKEPPKKLELPKEVSSSEASIKRGRETYEAIECHKCHGTNLAKRWNFRGGRSRTDIATRIANGVLGTPMPAFLEAVEKPEDIWHLTNFIMSLGPDAPRYATLVTVTAVREAISDDPDAEMWKKITPNNIPLMGQVIIDPRNFNPSIDLVSVRAVYNDTEIAFHLTWDDPSHTTKGDGKTTFPDAIAVQFPPQITADPERPYFLMGDDSQAVYLLRWVADKGVSEASANGPTKIAPIKGGEATGKVVYANGQYRLVMKRPLVAQGTERPTFYHALFTPVAFQAWDGGAGEAGPKMSLTSWYYLRLEEPASRRKFVIPPVVALLTLAAMVLIVRAARSRANNT